VFKHIVIKLILLWKNAKESNYNPVKNEASEVYR